MSDREQRLSEGVTFGGLVTAGERVVDDLLADLERSRQQVVALRTAKADLLTVARSVIWDMETFGRVSMTTYELARSVLAKHGEEEKADA